MSNYAAWDLMSLGKRYLEWRERLKNSTSPQQAASYAGELAVIGLEFNRKFFTGPYFPPSRPSGNEEG